MGAIDKYKTIPKDIFGMVLEKGLISFLIRHNREWSWGGGKKKLLKT